MNEPVFDGDYVVIIISNGYGDNKWDRIKPGDIGRVFIKYEELKFVRVYKERPSNRFYAGHTGYVEDGLGFYKYQKFDNKLLKLIAPLG